jgi:tripartite-type tricarboxylate transporter receptor subunit TctC
MIDITRRAAFGLAGALAAPRIVQAQGGADRSGPIRIIVPYAPGGVTDATVRVMSGRLADVLGQPVVIENRPGGGATIGAAAVAAARPDGTTLLIEGHPYVTNPLSMRDIPFNYAEALIPVTQIARAQLAVGVKTDLPARTVAEFVDLAKARPGALSCGHSGVGSGGHLMFLLFCQQTGVQLTEVPYRGGGEMVRDLASGTLDSGTPALVPLIPLASAGRLRILAIAGGARSSAAPDVPTLIESGYPGARLEEWLGFFAPAGTPEPIQERLRVAVATVLREPEVLARFATLGNEAVGNSPAEFNAFIQQRREQAGGILRAGGITLR